MTDPPYELGFMGKGWDKTGIANCIDVWREVLRVLKPGGHLLAFSGTRTYHRMVCAIEDAGFEIRDQIGWLYGSGFPKSLDVSKAIDKRAGATRKVVGRRRGVTVGATETYSGNGKCGFQKGEFDITLPASPASDLWQGWGTALKPAWEPIVLARKPLIGTVAENVLKHGTGGINVDGCRVKAGDEHVLYRKPTTNNCDRTSGRFQKQTSAIIGSMNGAYKLGRWPANVIHDGSPEVLAEFGKFGEKRSAGDYPSESTGTGNGVTYCHRKPQGQLYADTGTAARFFYCSKASKKDRDESGPDGRIKNNHPTVKPTALMRYLCKLVTPPAGIVLDPFTGSGSTGKAALLEGFSFIGIERDPEYLKIAKARIKAGKANAQRSTPNAERRMQNCLSAAQ